MTTRWHCPELLRLYEEALERVKEDVGESTSTATLLVDFRRVPDAQPPLEQSALDSQDDLLGT
jgi:hypothetical protein